MATSTAKQKHIENTTFAAIAVGAVTALAVGTMLAASGGGYGLIPWDEFATLRFENFLPGTAFKTVALAVGSFLAGGFIAARWCDVAQQSWKVGVGTWALTTSLLIVAFGPFTISTLSAATAGTKPAVDAMVETIESLRPRLVSDQPILKGKIVTTMDLKPPKKGALEQVAEHTQKPQAKREAAKIAYRAERFQLLGFTVLLFSLLAAIGGSWLATHEMRLKFPRFAKVRT